MCSGNEFLNEFIFCWSYDEALDTILLNQILAVAFVVSSNVYGDVEFDLGQAVSWNCPSDELGRTNRWE